MEYSVYFSLLIRETSRDEVKRGYYAMRETSVRDRANKIIITYTNNRHSRKGDNSTVLNRQIDVGLKYFIFRLRIHERTIGLFDSYIYIIQISEDDRAYDSYN